jgi:Zn-dependent protease
MLNYLFTSPFSFLIWLGALFVAITIHEAAHAWMADRLGDPTARLNGRLTLNPLAHLDPIGTLMLLLFRFGWGKPVPFDPFNLRHPRRDAALISFAGPASNLILATILAIIIRLAHLIAGPPALILELLITPLIGLCVILAIFNLIPIHPLDGGKILIGLLPEELAYKWDQVLSQYGFLILIFLIFPFFGISPVIAIISPIINLILSILLPGTPLI